MESTLVTVPDMPASELSALLAKELSLGTGRADLADPFTAWDFYRGVDGTPIPGRGKTFEVRLFTFPENLDHPKDFSERRAAMHKAGYIGHVGAFLQWRRICGLEGWHSTIPENNACWDPGPSPGLDSSLSIPFTVVEVRDRRLGSCFLDGVGRPWWTYLGFKEVILS